MVLRRVFLAAFAPGFLLCASAQAEITVQRLTVEKAPPILLLKGTFSKSDDPQLLAREVAASGAKVVTFDSGGGNVMAAMAYGKTIRSLGLTTIQLRASECASACTLAFIGGIVRHAEPGSIGVHQSSFSADTNIDSHEAVTVVQALTADMMTYLIEMDVDPKLLQLSLSVPSDDMRYLTASEMRSYRITFGENEELDKKTEISRAEPKGVPAAETSPTTTEPVIDQKPISQTAEQRALVFIAAYHDAWSEPNSSALNFMANAYSDVVDFYGKSIPKAGVLEEKRKFAMRWPTRAYTVKPDTARASCTYTCRVEGVVEWYAERGLGDRASSGSAEFSLVWDPVAERIISETGKVIETDKGATKPLRLLSRWHEEDLRCRGSSGDAPDTMAACDRREAVGGKLESVGWCYGREGEYGYQMQWHRCDSSTTSNKVAAASPVRVDNAQKTKPSDYPSRNGFKGKTVLPDFRGRDREFNSFRTRIRDGLKQGPDFAGHYSVIQFGCGTGCSSVIVADNRTGRPAWFPRGGEQNMSLELQFQLNSRLLAAQWLDYDAGRCVIEFFDYDRETWNLVNKLDIGSREACDRAVSENLR